MTLGDHSRVKQWRACPVRIAGPACSLRPAFCCERRLRRLPAVAHGPSQFYGLFAAFRRTPRPCPQCDHFRVFPDSAERINYDQRRDIRGAHRRMSLPADGFREPPRNAMSIKPTSLPNPDADVLGAWPHCWFVFADVYVTRVNDVATAALRTSNSSRVSDVPARDDSALSASSRERPRMCSPLAGLCVPDVQTDRDCAAEDARRCLPSTLLRPLHFQLIRARLSRRASPRRNS